MSLTWKWSALFLFLTGAMFAGEAQGEGGSAAIESQSKHSLSWKRTPKLTSRWVEELSLATPLPEYPRPQLVREEWLNLNGEWDFLGDGPVPPALPKDFPDKALVPSATQAVTSCLAKPWIRGWYRKRVAIPAAWEGKKVLLHFEAVGGISTVYVNSKELGKNNGSFKRFTFELPEVKTGQSHEIVIHFDDTDPRIPRGKPGRMSGIWQTVWLEPVSQRYIRSFRQTPDIDAGQLKMEVDAAHAADGFTLLATAHDNGNTVASAQGNVGEPLVLDIKDPKLWSPEDPFLYDLRLELRKGEAVVDRVQSYFGMRKISTGEVDGMPRIFLNNEVYYQTGLLDQGTWPDSFYTQPSDKCLKWEIETARKMGFNVLRKHVKLECSRWYYWCDVLGMLVWQDLPVQGYFSGKNPETEGDKQFQRDGLRDMIEEYYNHPSIISWVIFNEGGGQFEPRQMTALAKRLDDSRLINTTSHIWPNDLGRKRYNADYYDAHCYQRTLTFYDNDAHIPATFGEYGGIGYLVKDNSEEHQRMWGYGPDAESEEELLVAYENLVIQACRMRAPQNLCAIIYTELTDFYGEINGFITFDRKVVKVDVEEMRKINMLFRDPASDPGPLKELPKKPLQKVKMPATKGRIVRIELVGDGRVLSLAEVQVFEKGRNFALEQKASASSVAFDGVPGRAVDGNTDGDYGNNSVTHTETSSNPWWEVDLGRTVHIEKIKVYNRSSGGFRLNGFTLEILDDNRQAVFSQKKVKAAEVIEFSK